MPNVIAEEAVQITADLVAYFEKIVESNGLVCDTEDRREALQTEDPDTIPAVYGSAYDTLTGPAREFLESKNHPLTSDEISNLTACCLEGFKSLCKEFQLPAELLPADNTEFARHVNSVVNQYGIAA